jgi:hypothetical protein
VLALRKPTAVILICESENIANHWSEIAEGQHNWLWAEAGFFLFATTLRLVVVPTHPPIQNYQGLFCWGKVAEA